MAVTGPLFGQKLNRDEALLHPILKEFSPVVDFVVKVDPLMRRHHDGHEPQPA